MDARLQEYKRVAYRVCSSIALLFLIVAAVGCTSNSTDETVSESTDSSEQTRVAIAAGDIATVVEDGIEIADTQARKRLLPVADAVTRVHELAWDGQEAVVWVEEHANGKADETYYTIEQFNFDENTQTTVYLSRSEPYSIAFAQQSSYISFLEAGALYVLDVVSTTVHRVTEQVDRGSYVWSPDFSAVLVRLSDKTVYIEIDNGVAASVVTVYEKPLDGLAFVSGSVVLGIEQEESTARLVQINLQTAASTVVHEWQYEYDFIAEDSDNAETEESVMTDDMRMHHFETVISPFDVSYLAIEEAVAANDESAVYLYNGTDQRVPVGSDMELVGWGSDTDLILYDYDREKPGIVQRNIDTRKTIDLYDAHELFSVLTPSHK